MWPAVEEIMPLKGHLWDAFIILVYFLPNDAYPFLSLLRSPGVLLATGVPCVTPGKHSLVASGGNRSKRHF